MDNMERHYLGLVPEWVTECHPHQHVDNRSDHAEDQVNPWIAWSRWRALQDVCMDGVPGERRSHAANSVGVVRASRAILSEEALTAAGGLVGYLTGAGPPGPSGR
jgi:hypothetical protein